MDKHEAAALTHPPRFWHIRRSGRLLILFVLLLTTCVSVFTLSAGRALAASTVSINKNVEFQQIDGFGGFGGKLPWFTGGPFYDSTFVNNLTDDLGLTILRDEIPPHFEQDPGVFDVNATARDSCQGQSVSAADHMPYLSAMKAKMDSEGIPFKLILSTWSPPAWMKYVNCVFGGDINWNRLITSEIPSAASPNDRKADYAAFLVKYVQTVKQQTGIDVYAVSIQNEPAFPESYPSAVYSPEVLANTLKVVAQAFRNAGLTTKIFMPEDVTDYNRITAYVQWAMQDPTIRQYVDIVAVHGYGADGVTSGGSQTFWNNMNGLVSQYNAPLWMTETSGYDPNWTGAMNLAGSIYTALKYGHLGGWVWWALSDSAADAYSLMANGSPTPLYYASKQFYRYIRPGAVMVDANSDDPDVLAAAFKHVQQKTTTAVLINKSSGSKTVNLNITGENVPGSFSIIRSSATENTANVGTVSGTGSITLPANSVTTLYGTSGAQDSLHAPSILGQPQNATVNEGYPVTLSVSAAGTPNLQYQWQRNGTDIPNATGSTYIHSATSGDNGAQYRVRISNAQGSITSNSATLTVTAFSGANFSQTSAAPSIDGNAGDAIWSTAPSYSLSHVTGSPGDFSATYQGAWDSNNLYLLYKVHDPGFSSSTDNVEVYLDGNNTKVPNAYVKGDWQYIFNWGSTTVSQYQGGRSGNDVAGHSIGDIQFSQVANGDNSGYQIEIKIPWYTLGVTPSTGQYIGFDTDVAQQHTAGTTAGKVFWHNSTDDAWHDPSSFGAVKLGGSGGNPTPTPTPNPTPTPTPNPMPTPTPTPNPGGGSGLKGDYYNTIDLSGSVTLSRTDAQVNFDWGNGSPGGGINSDNFSVRWTGQVQATASGNYTFSTTSDDGVRLWVNGQQVINNWTDHASTTDNSAAIALTAGQKYDLKMEFYEHGGGAVAKLLWTPPGGSQQAIPQSQLYPATGGGSGSGWTKCADDGGTCTVSGTQAVRYGAGGQYSYKTVTGSASCNVATFGDPGTGATKTCEAASLPPTGWTKCADEGGSCAVSGTVSVAYGANGQFYYKSATNSISCSNGTFGDPIVGTVKACYYLV